MPLRTWQIGEITITRLVELRNVRDPNFVFPHLSREKVLEQGWLQPHFATGEGQLISLTQAFVLEGGGRRVIVDTCIGNGKERRNPPWHNLEGPFLDQLTEAGFPPDTIDTVICTHMHVDHVGWNTRKVGNRWVPTFQNAKYLFGKEEWDHWSAETDQDIDGDVAPHVAANVLEARAVYRDSILPIVEAGLHRTVDVDYQVSDEIFLIPTPGHTPGHVSVCISSQGHQAVITGDLMHHPIQCADPLIDSAFDHNIALARLTRERFLRQYADRPVLVIGTHFAGPTAGRIQTHGARWRFSVDEEVSPCSCTTIPPS